MHKRNTTRSFLVLTFLLVGLFVFSTCKNEPQKPKTPSTTTTTTTAPNVPRFNRDSAYAYVQRQVDFGPRNPGSAGHAACKAWLIEKLESFGGEVTAQEFDATVYTGEVFASTNIFAQFKPESTNRILLGAHYDTRPIADSPFSTERQNEPILGADDGASGVGVLLEIARILGQDTTLDMGVDIVFFDIEDYGEGGNSNNPESWAIGSRYFAKNLPYTDGIKPKFGILLDMVGSKAPRFLQEGYSMQYAPDLVTKIWKLAGFMGYSNYFVPQRDGSITDDHVPINQIAKIPMVDIINLTGVTTRSQVSFGAHWHTHNDNMDVIDKSTLRAVGNVVLQVIYREDAGVL